MKKTLFFAIVLMMIIVLSYGCSPPQKEINYLGKNRKEVLSMCDKYQQFSKEDARKKIVIGVGSGYHYYDSEKEVLSDTYVMQASSWKINFTHGRRGILRIGTIFYYEVVFENDKVTSQKTGYISDAF